MSSVQLSTSWYYWVDNLANGLADDTITALEVIPADYQLIVPGIVAVPLAMIVILLVSAVVGQDSQGHSAHHTGAQLH